MDSLLKELNTRSRNFLLCISAPAGTGKTTIAECLLPKKNLNIKKFTTCTSRSPRKDEVDGRCYNFLERGEFQRQIDNDEFVEWEETHGNLYGIRKKDINDDLSSNKNLLLVIDIRGSFSIKEIYPSKTVLIALTPPSLKELKNRLYSRGGEDTQVLAKRLKTAERELKSFQENRDKIDYMVTNDRLDKAVADIESIIVAEQLKVVNY